MPNKNSASTSTEGNNIIPAKKNRTTANRENNVANPIVPLRARSELSNQDLSNQSLKLIPPAPILRMSVRQTPEDILLMLDIKVDSNFASIKSFLLYARHESNSNNKSKNEKSWKELGEINSLGGPMKCTLKKRTRNIKCHFTARAVDIYDRVGPWSQHTELFIN